MRSLLPSFVAALVPAALVVAHGADGHHVLRHNQARQAPPSSPPAVAPTGAAVPPPGAAAPAATTSTSISFSLDATNPTAVPLASITASQSSYATLPLSSTVPAGAIPSYIPGAPGVPDITKLIPANYPALDIPPPIDSPEVQQWIQEVANSGITIPDFQPTNPGGCPNNTDIDTDPTRCWWTCTGCTGPQDITECPDPLTWGITYDDGPAFYTPNLLQYLDSKALKATFFVVGSRVISFPAILQDQYLDQHQIAVHTWSHPYLTTQSNEQIIAELGWSKKVIKDVLGVTPNMMRPPYGDIDDRVRAISLAMGLKPVIWTRYNATTTFDTNDFNVHNGMTSAAMVLATWLEIVKLAEELDTGFIVLEHDLFQEAVELATGYILPDALAHNPPFKIQPVITCIGQPLSNGYIETNNNSTNPPPNPNIGNFTAPHGSAAGSAGGASKSDAGRHYAVSGMVVSALIVGATGFAVGIFTTL